MSIKVKFKYTKMNKMCSKQLSGIVSHNGLLSYLVFNEEFNIDNNATYFHLGVVISHIFKPIEFL